MSDPEIAVLCVSVEGNKDNLSPFLSRDSHQFGKLDVVTDQNGDDAAIGIEDLNFVTRRDSPPLFFARRNMDFVLFAKSPIASEEIRDVKEFSLFDGEVRTTDHIHIVFDGHLGEEVEILGCELRKLPGGLSGSG